MRENQMNSTPVRKASTRSYSARAGTIGAASAKEFAAEGAEVFLAGRCKSSVEAVENEIAARGGQAHAAAIDTLGDAAVNQYVDGIVM